MATATNISPKDLARLAATPLDAAPDVRAFAAAAEAAESTLADLQAREQRARSLTDPNIYRQQDRPTDRTEVLTAQMERPTAMQLATAEEARNAAVLKLTVARAAERARRLALLHELRQAEMPALRAKYEQLLAQAAALAEVERAFAELWPDVMPERFAVALASPERLEAWRAAALTYGIKV